MRSKLFVPGVRAELFAKALAGPADAVCFDVEDSVPAARKAAARAAVRDFLLSNRAGQTDKTLIVRVNALETADFAEDIAALAVPGVAVINLPKPGSAACVQAAATALQAAERAGGVASPIGLLLNIETPRALQRAAELAQAHPRVVGLQLGLGDLFEPLGIDRADRAAIHHVLLSVRLAAGQAGVYAYDGAFADIANAEGFRSEAEMSRRLGFLGKSCIHPSQVSIANAVYQPTAAELAHAEQVVRASDQAEAQGLGACVVDGKMIDAPFVTRARDVLANARRYGLCDGLLDVPQT